MFRTASITALAAAALAAAAATPALADPGLASEPVAEQASIAAMKSSIRQQLTGKVFGWEMALAQDGHPADSDAGGKALSAVDGPNGKAVDMTPAMPMELASATKTITAMSTLQLLRANHLTVDSSVDPYLPVGWKRGPGFKEKKVTFRLLLTHTSGLKQALTAMKNPPTDNGWTAMQTTVANGTKLPATRAYKNANFALLRIIDAELWRRSGGQRYTTEEVEVYNTHGIEIGTKEVKEPVPVNQTTSAGYALDHMRKKLFEPAGLQNISCAVADPKTAVKSYPQGAPVSSTKGYLHVAPVEECAGARGIRFSALQHVQLLAHLRHGDIVDPEDEETMDELRAGWNEDSDGGDGGEFGSADGVADNAFSPGVFWHGGDLLGTMQLHTCGMTFDDGIEASLMVNSTIAGDSPCGVLLKAWLAAS